MKRRSVFPALGAAVAAAAALPADAAFQPHHLAMQVSQRDEAIMNLALNNAANVTNYYTGRGESVEIEIVAYGPGLHMLREDTSPVKDRLKNFKDGMPNVVFSGCNVTKTSMEKAEGHPIALVPQAQLVPTGVVRLMSLQEARWSYIRP